LFTCLTHGIEENVLSESEYNEIMSEVNILVGCMRSQWADFKNPFKEFTENYETC